MNLNLRTPERRHSKPNSAQPRQMIAVTAYCCCLLLLNCSAAEDLTLLNQVTARHEWVHRQVSPAVVAVESRAGKQEREGQSFYGTGVVVSPGGMVLTSSTVVPSPTRIVQIYFPDGKVFDAKVLATDEKTESCALQVVFPAGEQQKPLPYVELCDSSKVSVGELAYTAGNPFHTIKRDGQVAWSVGTISGIYNIVSADEQSRYHGIALETDAAVNPGSDGGPLIDSQGRVLGLLSLGFCESRWLGTAIPAHLIHSSLEPVRALPLRDPQARAGTETGTSTGAEAGSTSATALSVRYDGSESASVARAVPEALRTVSRATAKAMVKLMIKRPERSETSERKSLVRRLRQRPDAPATGVMIEGEGYILTSAFNVEGEVRSIEAQLADGTTYPAQLLGRNLGLDVALLKVVPPKGTLFPAVSLAADPNLQIGRFVTVLGCSEDGPNTHTSGIVSALGRLDGCAVQTDALINYGNSGGPVIDLRGRVVGVAAFVRTHADWSQQNSGVGFFTSADKIIATLPDLKASRDIRAPASAFLGVKAAENATEIRGVKLERIVPGSAAESAKLLTGDVIVCVDGMDTHSWPALVRVLKAHRPGETIELTYQRGTVTGHTSATLTARKEE
ncbi:MAG TPA: trypsin-like peptidase domain-containing protein [Planctomycetota bacterium]|jgi:S1-C subfamily serine protease